MKVTPDEDKIRHNTSPTQRNKFAIFPAIDILDGNCVRLYQGDFNDEIVYNKDPEFVARKLESEGAKYLHIVDLDGAKSGMLRNLDLIKRIVSSVSLYVQVGGGIRDLNVAEQILNAGVNRIIIGSAKVKNPQMVKDAFKNFGPERIVVGLDCRDGYLAINGWQENSKIKAIDIAKEFKASHNLQTVIYTDIHRDGTLKGPNVAELVEFMTETGVDTIASGGISNLDDVKLLINHSNQNPALRGVIVGKALYAKKIQPTALFSLNV